MFTQWQIGSLSSAGGVKIADMKKEETSIEELEEILVTGKVPNSNSRGALS